MASRQAIPSKYTIFVEESIVMSEEPKTEQVSQSPEQIIESLQQLLTELEDSIRNNPAKEIEEQVADFQQRFQHLIEQMPETGDTVETDESEEVEEQPEAETPEWEEPLHQAESRLKELINIFEDHLEKEKEKTREEHEKNLQEKQAVISEMESIITTEESIGKAFDHFNELQRRWKGIGEVPAKKYQELQSAYSFQVERFYYTINIYKDLKELDLKKNLEAKRDLVKQMVELTREKSIKRMETMVKAYQEEWEETGPVPREEWEEVRDAFRSATRSVYHKIQSFYDGLKKQFNENLEKKEKLIQQAQNLAQLELKSPKKWNDKTQNVLDLQNEWKKIGFVPKAHNERVWKEFRTACNTFFDRKRKFFNDLRERQSKNKETKLRLIAEAEKLREHTDWKETTRQFINLQKRWKEVGPAERKDEQSLWKTFREHCDYFFEQKKHFFDTLDDRQAENLKAKKKLLEEIEAFELGKEVEKNVAQLKEFTAMWNEIGHVPKKNMRAMNDGFQKAMNQLYNKLNLGKEEKSLVRFKNRMDLLLQLDNPKQALDKERHHLRRKLKEVDDTLSQYELNMERFNVTKGNSPILNQVRQRIDSAKAEQAEISSKLKYIQGLFKKTN